jgi:hypothetical protein
MPELAPAPGELPAEDVKLITLARAARARVAAIEGAAVRDGDGRTYTGVTVSLPSFSLGALQLAVAAAVAAGAATLEAAALVTEASTLDNPSAYAVRDVSGTAPIYLADATGRAFAVLAD